MHELISQIKKTAVFWRERKYLCSHEANVAIPAQAWKGIKLDIHPTSIGNWIIRWRRRKKHERKLLCSKYQQISAIYLAPGWSSFKCWIFRILQIGLDWAWSFLVMVHGHHGYTRSHSSLLWDVLYFLCSTGINLPIAVSLSFSNILHS